MFGGKWEKVGAFLSTGNCDFWHRKGVLCVVTLPLLCVVVPLDVVELYILGATSEVCWVFSTAVG